MVMQIRRTLLVCAFAVLWAGPNAIAGPVVPDSLRACAAIGPDGDRLACYDREMTKLGPATTTATAAPAPAPAPAAAAAPAAVTSPAAAPAASPTPEQRFGLSAAEVEAKYPHPGESEPLIALEAKVASVRDITNHRVLVDLDNGQQWRQVDTDVTVRLQPGDSVSIKRNSFGSYWLSSNGRAWRFKRVH